MKLDVLAICAHPDDAEITCGGTLTKFADMGKAVGVLDLTAGEMGTLGDANSRLDNARDASKIMGLKARENLELPDSKLEINHKNTAAVAEVIRKYQPQTVILPYWDKQRHPDHRITSQLGYDACFIAGLKKMDIPGEPHRPHKILYASSHMDVKHSFFVDISEQFDRKLAAIRAYKSQFDGSKQAYQIYKPGNDIFEVLHIYHREYGILVGCQYAEAFIINEPILIDDPTLMKVRSI